MTARLASLPVAGLRRRAERTALREGITAAGLAAVVALLLFGLLPPTGDAPAHFYRTFLVREGAPFWDNLWFGGHYPLASYSLLYYLPAALLGDLPLVFAAVVASAALFSSIVIREWGADGIWPSRSFAVVVSGSIFTGTYSYAAGLAALLLCVRAVQTNRAALAIVAAALTLGFSPLAFIFLCLVLGACALARRRLGPGSMAVAASLVVLGALQLAVLGLFPTDGVYPFRPVELLAVLATCALGGALALRTPRGRALAALLALWGSASLVAFAVASPVGENVTRLRSLMFPLVLLVASLARFRPRRLALGALAFALVYNAAPYLGPMLDRPDRRGADEAFWTPVIDYLDRHPGRQYRVEVVPTFDHWEAYWLPRAGYPLARGWYRQIDLAHNPVLYRRPLAPEGYRAWLRRMGVRFVVLPHTLLGEKGELREAQLLRSGRSGLALAHESPEATIYELSRPTPILTGPSGGRITAITHSSVEGEVAAAGRYLIRVRFSPYWTVSSGEACLEPAPGGMMNVRVRRPGRFVLSVPETAPAIVRAAVAGAGSRCPKPQPA